MRWLVALLAVPLASAKPCTTNSDCPRTQYCNTPACTGIGKCEPTGTACLAEWSPVCGCDGAVYGNTCEAQIVGVSIRGPGECLSADRICDAVRCARPDCPVDDWVRAEFDCCFSCRHAACSSNADCLHWQYCNMPGCTGVGQCEDSNAEFVSLAWRPVCGCDGKTYRNSGIASLVGVSVLRDGQCSQNSGRGTRSNCPTTFCGGLDCDVSGTFDPQSDCCPTCGACTSNDECKPGQYCQQDGCSGEGRCLKRTGFRCASVSHPVCGCDRQTYASACNAAAAGTSVSSLGECSPIPEHQDKASPAKSMSDSYSASLVLIFVSFAIVGAIVVSVRKRRLFHHVDTKQPFVPLQ